MGYVEMGSRIAARRRELGLTQAQLAAQMKLTPQSVSAWERGKTVPEAERLEELAESLLTDEQYEMYEIYMTTSGNNPELFDETE